MGLNVGGVDPDLPKMKKRLAKNPTHCMLLIIQNKKIGTLPGAKAGEVIWYYNTDDKRNEALSSTMKTLASTNTSDCSWLPQKNALEIRDVVALIRPNRIFVMVSTLFFERTIHRYLALTRGYYF